MHAGEVIVLKGEGDESVSFFLLFLISNLS